MKMLFISHGNIPSRWAHTVQMMKMAEAFSRLATDFRVLTQAHWSRAVRKPFDYRRFYGLSRDVRVDHVYTHRQPWGPLVEYVYARGFFPRATEYAKRGRFDLIFTRAPQIAQRCVEAGLRCILETHSTTNQEQMDSLQAIANNDKLLGIVTISDVVRDQMTAAGIPEEKICVWPDAVDLSAYTNLPDQEELRRRLNLPRSATIAGYCGHLYQHRGVEEILTAAAQLPRVHFLLVGGWEKDVLRRRQEAAGLANVSFTGFVENRLVPAYLMASDMLLMPYSPECRTSEQMSPMKMFEYMAANRPIVATDLPALRRHLRHEVNSLLVRPDDGTALAEAISCITRSPSLAEAIAQQARIDVRPYAWERRATQILNQFVHRRHPTAVLDESARSTPARRAA